MLMSTASTALRFRESWSQIVGLCCSGSRRRKCKCGHVLEALEHLENSSLKILVESRWGAIEWNIGAAVMSKLKSEYHRLENSKCWQNHALKACRLWSHAQLWSLKHSMFGSQFEIAAPNLSWTCSTCGLSTLTFDGSSRTENWRTNKVSKMNSESVCSSCWT